MLEWGKLAGGMEQESAGYFLITYGKPAPMGWAPAASEQMIVYLCSFSGNT